MKTAILGSNSFAGSHLVEAILANTEDEVMGISISPENNPIFLPYLYRKPKPKRFCFHQLDINKDLEKILGLFDRERPAVIVNFAAQGDVGFSWRHPEHWFRTNCIGVVRLVNALKDRNYLKKYVQISTPEVYGSTSGTMQEDLYYFNPSTPYAASKGAGDLFLVSLAKTLKFPLIMIRPTNFYGRHQRLHKIIPRTIVYLKMGKKIELHGGGKAVKSFIHIRDVARGIFLAYQKGKTGELYHLSPDGGGHSIRQILKLICSKMDYDFEKATVSVEERVGQDTKYVLDSSKARVELGWRPEVDFEEGLGEVIQWIEDNWAEIQRQPLNYVHKEVGPV